MEILIWHKSQYVYGIRCIGFFVFKEGILLLKKIPGWSFPKIEEAINKHGGLFTIYTLKSAIYFPDIEKNTGYDTFKL